MFKLMIWVSLMFIGTSLWAARLSCDSCGSECASACGTRRFRTCCFNYLRRKRGPEPVQFSSSNIMDDKIEKSPISKLRPYFIVKNVLEEMIPNQIINDSKPYFFEDSIDDKV